MQLERLEITNFKSYRGLYTVGPFSRFTSVIGPNGSGKSNLLDAIIFAMNVPTGSLRAKSNSELVARGETECSVKVYLGDRVFERRLNASGSSTYLCDGARVTAGVYTENLEAVNIFGRIKNFVICQGDIIKSDVDLLSLIEHVSGSSRYTGEYKRLEEELTAANRDLSLKYERKKGYFEYLKEIKEGEERETILNRLVEERDQLQKLVYMMEIQNKVAEIRRVKVAMVDLKANLGRYAQENKIHEINMLRGETIKLQKEYFEKESELAFLRGRNKNGGDLYVKEKQEELMSLEKEYKRLEDILRQQSTGSVMMSSLENVAKYEEVLKSASPIIAERENAYKQAVEEKEKRLAEITLNNFDKINRQERLMARKKSIRSKIANILQRQQREKAELEAKTGKRAMIGQEIAGLKKRIEDKEERYDQIVADEERLNNELSSIMQSILLSKARKSDALKRSVIANVVDNLKSIFSGVHGRVIDLITPIQKKYELSIGVLLSSYDMAVVVDSEAVALDCIRYLKESKACRLTFIPLSVLRSKDRQRNAEYFKEDDSIKLAVHCTRCDPKYTLVSDFIFRNSLIVDSSDIGRRIAYSEKYPGNICTLGGLLMTPSGLITGGKEVKNKFDDNAIDKLLSRRASILADLGLIKDRKEAFSDIRAVKERIAELKGQYDALEGAVQGTCTTDEELESLRIEESTIGNELRLMEVDLKDFELERGEIRGFMKEVEMGIFYEVLSRLHLKTLSEYKRKVSEIGELKGRYARLKGLDDDIQVLKEDIERSQALQKSNDVVDLVKLGQEVQDLYNKLEHSKARLRSVSDTMKGRVSERDELNRKILNCELLKAKLEEELKDIKNYIFIECGVTINENGAVLGDDTENISNVGGMAEDGLKELYKELNEINKKIDECIPPVTVDDGTVKSKYTMFNKEYAEAKEYAVGLKQEFYEVKQKRMNAFNECFKVITQEVPGIYKMLCGGGGEGNAYIVYEGDPFVNNLKYYLMPPSKRFTEFKELSGGEKSLALLSFIFALNRFKKAPFYIFDEVDSALDKANVERLVSFMREVSEQFIVITLKQQVFQHSDALVGIYRCPREDRSKILTYRLKGVE